MSFLCAHTPPAGPRGVSSEQPPPFPNFTFKVKPGAKENTVIKSVTAAACLVLDPLNWVKSSQLLPLCRSGGRRGLGSQPSPQPSLAPCPCSVSSRVSFHIVLGTGCITQGPGQNETAGPCSQSRKKSALKVLKYEVFSFPLCSLFVCQGVFSLLFNVLSVEELAF